MDSHPSKVRVSVFIYLCPKDVDVHTSEVQKPFLLLCFLLSSVKRGMALH